MHPTPTLDALSAVEQAAILTTLLRAHPELAREAEAIAAERLAEEDSDEVAAVLADELRALRLEQLADCAGPQRGSRTGAVAGRQLSSMDIGPG